MTPIAAAVESAPAAGADIKQIAIGGIATGVWMAIFVVLGLRHRAGTTDKLDLGDAFVRAKTVCLVGPSSHTASPSSHSRSRASDSSGTSRSTFRAVATPVRSPIPPTTY